jgi:hypothetical protein
MNDLTTRLRDADPVRLEAGLPAETREGMRRAILSAAEAGGSRAPQWRQPLALAAVGVLTMAGAAAAHRFAEARERPTATAPAAPPVATQVQFRTPGGTRIIWTIDPAFHLGGHRP